MSRLREYLEAADRENTRRSYESSVRHFEVEWHGLLPATSDLIARYLSDQATTLSINTLRHRLAALSRWHADHGFPDPTKSPIVRQVLKGIRTLHPAPEKRARPLELEVLQQVNDWLDHAVAAAQDRDDRPTLLRLARDRSLLLLGFWRGFRADELVHLRIEHVEIILGEGLTCYLPRSKGDRQLEGHYFQCPALSRLCPVAAFEAWLARSGLTEGPVFRKIDRHGRLAEKGLAPNSLIPILRNLFSRAGVVTPEEYSSHSLRRGFAGWARASGWDLKELMEYVGWKDIKSAMRYLDAADPGLKARFERGLPPLNPADQNEHKRSGVGVLPMEVPLPTASVQASLSLTSFSKSARGVTRARRLIEQTCFERYAMQRLDSAGVHYLLTIPNPDRESLDDVIYSLLDDMHRIADDNQCSLEATLHDPATDSYWD